jgi:prepilin-type N-terminal cleavage/methylation domain-containing protein
MKSDTNMNLLEKLNGDKRGFSTIELIMVIVISGIMMAVALPKLGVVNTIDLESVTRQVKSDIRYTQEIAMSRYKKATITFDSNLDTYTITSTGSSESKELPERSKAIFNAVGTGTTNLVFTFNSSGEPVTGAGGTLRITSEGSYNEIKIENMTGRATIQ